MANSNMVLLEGQNFTCVVRTQAGFKKALKRYKKDKSTSEHFGYPTSYPSLVVFSVGYQGYHYTEARCFPINDILSAVKKSEALFAEEKKKTS